MREHVALSAALAIGLGLCSAVARAAPLATERRDSNAPGTHAAVFPVPIRLEGSLDIVRAEDAGWAPGIRGTALALLGPFEFGASSALETQFFGYSRAGLSGVAGLRLQLQDVELDAAGTLGAAWACSPHDLVSDDPGACRALAFAGGRAGMTWLPRFLSNPDYRWGFALHAAYERDLNHYRVTYSYTESPLFDSDQSDVTKTVAIGTQRLALYAAIVIAFD